MPWARGKSLLWDFTCRDTFARSYIRSSSRHVAEKRKIDHYNDLAHRFVFIPIAAANSTVIGKFGLDLVKKIGTKITDKTGEKRSTMYLLQRISHAIQKGNTASILGTIPPSKDLE